MKKYLRSMVSVATVLVLTSSSYAGIEESDCAAVRAKLKKIETQINKLGSMKTKKARDKKTYLWSVQQEYEADLKKLEKKLQRQQNTSKASTKLVEQDELAPQPQPTPLKSNSNSGFPSSSQNNVSHITLKKSNENKKKTSKFPNFYSENCNPQEKKTVLPSPTRFPSIEQATDAQHVHVFGTHAPSSASGNVQQAEEDKVFTHKGKNFSNKRMYTIFYDPFKRNNSLLSLEDRRVNGETAFKLLSQDTGWFVDQKQYIKDNQDDESHI